MCTGNTNDNTLINIKCTDDKKKSAGSTNNYTLINMKCTGRIAQVILMTIRWKT